MSSADETVSQGAVAVVNDNETKLDGAIESTRVSEKQVGKLNVVHERNGKPFLSVDEFAQPVEKLTGESVGHLRGRTPSRRNGQGNHPRSRSTKTWARVESSANGSQKIGYYCAYDDGKICNNGVSGVGVMCSVHETKEECVGEAARVAKQPVIGQFTCAYRYENCTTSVKKPTLCCTKHWAMVEERMAARLANSAPETLVFPDPVSAPIVTEATLKKVLTAALEMAQEKTDAKIAGLEKSLCDKMKKNDDKLCAKVVSAVKKAPPPPPQPMVVNITVSNCVVTGDALQSVIQPRRSPPLPPPRAASPKVKILED